MNQLQFTSQQEAIRKAKARNAELNKAFDEDPAKFHAIAGSRYPLHVEVYTEIPVRIPNSLSIHSYCSFPMPNKARMFLFTDKSSFEKFRLYLRTLNAQFMAKVLPPPRHPNAVLKGF